MTSELNETKAVITLNQDNVPIFSWLGTVVRRAKVKRQLHFRIKVDRYQNIVVASL